MSSSCMRLIWTHDCNWDEIQIKDNDKFCVLFSFESPDGPEPTLSSCNNNVGGNRVGGGGGGRADGQGFAVHLWC